MNIKSDTDAHLWFNVTRNGQKSVRVAPGCIFSYNGRSDRTFTPVSFAADFVGTFKLKTFARDPEPVDDNGTHHFTDEQTLEIQDIGRQYVYLALNLSSRETEHDITIVGDTGSPAETYKDNYIRVPVTEYYFTNDNEEFVASSVVLTSSLQKRYILLAEVELNTQTGSDITAMQIVQKRHGIVCVTKISEIHAI